MKRSSLRVLLVAAALSVAGALGAGCVVSARLAAPGIYYVPHRHVHDEYCGHYRVWADGYWAYYYGGRWEYYNPTYGSWVYWDRGYEPVVLRTHVSAAKVYRPAPRAGVVVKGSGPGYGASKAPPPASKRDSGYGASKAPPKKD